MLVAHLEQALVRDDDDRVDLVLQLADAVIGLHRTAATFETERARDHADRERADLLRDLRDHRRAARAGATALARGDEHHVGALQHLFDLGAVLLGGLPTDLGIGAGAETPRERATDVELHVGVRQEERLRVGVDRDELDALEPGIDHAVDRVAATAADADDLDDREIVLGSAEHRLPFWSDCLISDRSAVERRNPRSQLQVDDYVNLCFVSRLYRSARVRSNDLRGARVRVSAGHRRRRRPLTSM